MPDNDPPECEARLLEGGPYDGNMLVIHTDEPNLNFGYTYPIISLTLFDPCELISRAFLLMSYDEKYQYCPYVELAFKSEG